MQLLSRRSALRLGAGFLSAGAYPVLIEPQWLDVTARRVSLPGAEGLRILHLTDLHASWNVPLSLIERAVDAGLAHKPDLICLTGDFITKGLDFDFDAFVRALQRLSTARPTFAVLGNHDGGSWAQHRRGFADHSLVERLLDRAGVTLLHNRAERLSVKGRDLTLAGVGDLWTGELDAHRPFHQSDPRGPTIVLCHNPDGKELLSSYPWDLMLSGHTHGGQVIIPFEGAPFAPVRDLRFIQGLHTWSGRQLYISRGVGSIASVRFLCRPEVTILDLA